MKKFTLILICFTVLLKVNSQAVKDSKKSFSIENVNKLQKAAAKNFSSTPSLKDIEQSKELTPYGKKVFKIFRTVIEDANKLNEKSTEDEYNRVVKDLSWAILLLEGSNQPPQPKTNSTAKVKSQGIASSGNGFFVKVGDGNNKGCAKTCLDNYNACMADLDCNYDRDSFLGICLCCAPCSAEYVGCMLACTLGNGGGVIQ